MKKAKLNRSNWGNAIIFTLVALVAIFMSLPLVYTIMMAFKPLEEIFIFPPRFFVVNPTLKNFRDLFSVIGSSFVPFSRYLFNSILVAGLTTLFQIVLSAMGAYALAKHKFPGRQFIFNMIVYALMFSASVMGIVRFIVMSKIGILDSYAALIIPSLAGTLGLYLMKQFMEQIPDALIESARIDGANEWRILWTIAMPMVKPAWLTLLLLTVQGIWGDAASPALYIHTETLKTLPVMSSYITAGGMVRAGASSALGLIMMMVPITIFVVSQSNVIETMKNSGMKD